MMRELTLVLPHYMNLGMLAEQQRAWMAYPPALRARLHVVIVDDCSPKGSWPSRKSIVARGLGSIRLFRLLEKKRWNWLSCRNLGAQIAATPWMLLTDIDHVVPPATLERLLLGDLNEPYVYRFKRVTAPAQWPYDPATCAPWKPHNDTWLLTRTLFFDERVGGYDERLSGCYGTSGEFRDRLVRAASASVLLDETIVRYPREVIPDASTHPSVYTRKNDVLNDADLEERKRLRGMVPNWKPLHGLVKWREIPLTHGVAA